jgi:ABC-2 type transport system permease protein
MNVMRRELRARARSTIIWALALAFLAIVSMAKYETITAQGGAAIQEMLTAFPATIQAIFGMNGLDLTTVGGYFGVCFLLIALTLAVHAGLLGAGLIGQEEIDKTTEFLYVKPRGRLQIVGAKLCAGIIILALVWFGATLGSILGIRQFAQFGDFTRDFWLMMTAAALLQLLFFSVGACTAAMTRRMRGYGRIITILIFASYFLYVVAKLSPSLAFIHYFSVFSWFDAVDILATHSIKLHYAVITLALSGSALLLLAIRYPRRDLTT